MAIMSLSTEDRHVEDFGVVCGADPIVISPRDDSRQTDTRRVTNVVIIDIHIPMIVQPSIRTVTDVAKRIISSVFVEGRIEVRLRDNDGRHVLRWDHRAVMQHFKIVRNQMVILLL